MKLQNRFKPQLSLCLIQGFRISYMFLHVGWKDTLASTMILYVLYHPCCSSWRRFTIIIYLFDSFICQMRIKWHIICLQNAHFFWWPWNACGLVALACCHLVWNFSNNQHVYMQNSFVLPVLFVSKPYLTAALTIIQEWKARSCKGLQRMTQTAEVASSSRRSHNRCQRIKTSSEHLVEKHVW